MIRIGPSIRPKFFGSGAAPIDPDATAFITAAGITDATQQSAINALVLDLKAYGIWTKMKAIYPFCGGTASSHKWNLKDPRDLDAAFRLVFFGGGSHSSNGYLPNGVNSYANTNLNENTIMTLNNIHISHYSRTNNTNAVCDIGLWNNTTAMTASIVYSSGLSAIRNTDLSAQFTSPLSTAGMFINSRIISTQIKFFVNNALFRTITSNSVTKVSQNYFIGARNSGGSAALYSNRELAFASIGDGLTDTEAANFYTAVQAYQTTLSRNV
jgi:hypothetical protein